MPGKNNNNQEFFRYATLGFQILATVLLGVLAGQWIDKKFGFENNLFTLILSLLMIIVAMTQIIRTFLNK